MNYDLVIGKALEKRAPLIEEQNVRTVRLLHPGVDGIDNISVDMYNEYCLIQYFDDSAVHEPRLVYPPILKELLSLGIDVKGVLCKNRVKIEGNNDFNALRRSELLEGAYPPDTCIVQHNGMDVAVDLIEGQSTGLFMDMREVRDRLAGYYNSDDSLLNLFSYTCLFSVHSRLNGAATCVNVDLSKAVLNRGMDNYRLNGLHVDDRDFIYGDSLYWIRRLGKMGTEFTFVIVDPPTFSRHKKHNFSVKKDYSRMLKGIDQLVNKGYIVTAVNSYTVSKDEYFSYHPSHWKCEFFAHEAVDFLDVNDPYLKVALWKK